MLYLSSSRILYEITISSKKQVETVEEAMDGQNIKDREARMSRENALSMIKKLTIGSCIILMVGICAYAFLFLLMLAI